jgi:YfiH family protein
MCGVLTADCAPVLIADPEAKVVAAAHAGWKGAFAGVVGNAVEAMAARGARPERMVAAVGPCIGPRSYEVGEEFVQRFGDQDRAWLGFFSRGEGGKACFDLPGFVLMCLEQAGVRQAEWIGRDTFAEPDFFFSNRRAFKAQEPDYGRLLSAIMLLP